MALRLHWHDNAELEQWEATSSAYHAVAQFDRTTGRYAAYLEDATTYGTNHYAPESFSDPEDAKAWCEAEIERLEQEASVAGPAADDVIKGKISDELAGPGPVL